MDLQYIPARQLQPGDDDDVVADLRAIQPVFDGGDQFESRVGRSLFSVERSASPAREAEWSEAGVRRAVC